MVVTTGYHCPAAFDIDNDGELEVFNGFSTTNLYYFGIPAMPGDIDGVDGVTLNDVILGLKILSGIDTTSGNTGSDVDGDSAVGLAEVIYALRDVANLTP